MAIIHVARLSQALTTAGVAIVSVNQDGIVEPANLQAAADPIIAAFDDSEAANNTFLNSQARTVASEDIDSNKNPINKELRAAASLVVDEVNLLRDDVIGIASQTWDPASMANATGLTSPNFTVTGAAFGDIVHPIAPYTLAGVTATAYVSAANTAVIRLHNGTGAAVNLVSGSWSVMVLRHTVLTPRTMAQAKSAMQNKVNAGDVD
jgi:hypothetical protein